VVEPEVVDAAHSELEHLGPLPIVFEHRDCAPWNIVLSAAGNPALLDWESAEPQGLPLLDLVYFLANATFILEGALDSGRTRESYRRMLDPSTAPGAVAAQSLERYCHALGLDPLGVRPLRLLTWIVHARSDYSHSTLESPRPPAQETLAASTFLGLVREELACPAG
jgi:aminoglycoside phosphotransferase (APT) family kinase protein